MICITKLINDNLIRIVNVSSEAHRWRKGVIWNDLNMEKMEYDHGQAYTQSKVANILHAMELAKRLEDSGILAFSLHPGTVNIMECQRKVIFLCCSFPSGFVDTELFEKSGRRNLGMGCCGQMFMKMAETPIQGAQTTLVRYLCYWAV